MLRDPDMLRYEGWILKVSHPQTLPHHPCADARPALRRHTLNQRSECWVCETEWASASTTKSISDVPGPAYCAPRLLTMMGCNNSDTCASHDSENDFMLSWAKSLIRICMAVFSSSKVTFGGIVNMARVYQLLISNSQFHQQKLWHLRW
jgi:hypothetical protein